LATCMVCGGWIEDGKTKFVGRRCSCVQMYANHDGSVELRLIIQPKKIVKKKVKKKTEAKR